jgi:hypothetical protein
MFTPYIFMVKFCQRTEAWGYHCFLLKSQALLAQNQIQPQGDNLRKYHAQQHAFLHTFKTANIRKHMQLFPLGQLVK